MEKQYLQAVGTFKAKVAPLPEGGSYFHTGREKEDGTFGADAIRIPLVIQTPEGERIADWFGWMNTDKNADRTIAVLAKAFQFNGDLVSLQSGKQTFEGMDCEIVTVIETYENKPRCKVKWLNPVGGGQRSAPDAAKIDSIVKRLQSRAKAVAAATLKEQPATTAPASKPASKDDIPY